MQSFKAFLNESMEVPAKQVTGAELLKAIGRGKVNSIAKHPWMKEIANYQHAYKYGVSPAGFDYVEIYAYMSSIHTTPEGKIRPETMLKFTLSYSGRSVVQVDKYFRSREPNDMEKRFGPSAGWKHLKTWEKK